MSSNRIVSSYFYFRLVANESLFCFVVSVNVPTDEIGCGQSVGQRPFIGLSVPRGLRPFSGKLMEGMGWNLVWWCILTISRYDSILVAVFRFSYFCAICIELHGSNIEFSENPSKEWSENRHTYVSWPHSEMVCLFSSFLPSFDLVTQE